MVLILLCRKTRKKRTNLNWKNKIELETWNSFRIVYNWIKFVFFLNFDCEEVSLEMCCIIWEVGM